MIEMRGAAVSHVGQVRDNNQDRAMFSTSIGGVADGMGGHVGGEQAASIAIAALETVTQRLDAEQLAETVQQANRNVFGASADPDFRGMGTTLVAASLHPSGETITVANVGDSRAYRLRSGIFEQLTIDHSLVSELVRQGRITSDEAESHPQRNIVTRALGLSRHIEVDLFEHRAGHGDRFVLCSDGLFNEIADHVIADEVNRFDEPAEAAERLVELALEHGARDNVSVVVIDLVDPDADPPVRTAEVTLNSAGPDEPTTRHLPIDVATNDDEPTSSTLRNLAFGVAGIALALLLATAAVALLSRNTFVVADRDGEVVVLQGSQFLWLDPDVVERTGIRTEELTPGARERLAAGVEWSSRADADEFVSNLEFVDESAAAAN